MCGYKTVVGMVNGMLEELKITVPVALHLDHGSYEGAKACIEAGFSSIMFDGSHYPIEENVEKTKELVGIIVNLSDYCVGSDKGGAINWFDDFDIDFNQQKYLIETRCSGALIKPKSCIVLWKPVSQSANTTPETDNNQGG
jgi:hypothetical protein